MQKTIFLILTLLATLRASAVPLNFDNLVENQNYTVYFSITLDPGSGLPAGSILKGQLSGQFDHPNTIYLRSGKFDFWDPSQKHQHQVMVDGYSDDMNNWMGETGGGVNVAGYHPRHWNYVHHLEMSFNLITGRANGFVEGGWEDSGDVPTVDFQVYRYDFTGDITMSLEPIKINAVPETNSTLALIAASFGLMIVARKKLAAA